MPSTNVVIGDILPRTQGIASGGQTVYSTNWTANAASDVVVYSRAAAEAADDETQILAYPADYSVAFIGDQQQVQVTLVTPSTLGDIVTITRQTPADRMNLYSNTNFTPTMLNSDFGILTLVDQQAQLVDQLVAPRYNYSAIIIDEVDTILPILPANSFWVKNGSDTEIITMVAPESGIAPAGATYITLTDWTSELPNSQPLSDSPAGLIINNPIGENVVTRSITGSANEITITNPTGVGGNINVAIASNPNIPGSAGMALPQGTTGERVTPSFGISLRYNTTTNVIEYYNLGTDTWVELVDFDISDATYLIQVADANLPNAQVMASLGTGIVKNTTSTGVQSISASLTSLDGLTTATNEMVYLSAANTWHVITAANDSVLATSGSGVPGMTQLLPAAVQLQIGSFNSGTSAGATTFWRGDGTWASVETSIGQALTKSDDTNVTLTLGGTPATALLDAVSLTLGWTGELSLARGGSNAALTASAGSVVYSTASAMAFSAVGSSGQIFQSTGTTAPGWTTATYPSTAGTNHNIITSDGTNFSSATLTAVIDAALGNTQGDLLYRNGTVWTVLAPGSAGQVLTTGGAAANPAWADGGETGTVTSIATNNGITGGTITTTGTIGLANVSDSTILSNISGGSTYPTPNTLTGILDHILGSAQGDIIFRGSSVWEVLAPGMSGQVLTSGGASADVSWTTNGAGTVTSVATNNGLTGGTITSTGTLGLAAIADGTLLANVSGGSLYPSSTTLTALIDYAIGSTQGDILYRNGSAWVVLAPGTSGYVLATQGAAANPHWIAASTGTVTSVATNNGLTGGAITTTGTLGLAAIADGDLLANVSGGSLYPSATTLTALIDYTLGSTQGDILYRNGTVWTVLGPGTSGQYLQTKGASANPIWAAGTNTSLAFVHANISGGDLMGVTGDGTIYTIVFNNVVLDRDSNYNSGTGVFTAPATGYYAFSYQCNPYNYATDNTRSLVKIVATGGTYVVYDYDINTNLITDLGAVEFVATNVIPMTSGDTAKWQIQVSGHATKNINIGSGIDSTMTIRTVN